MPALSPNGQILLYRSERQDSIGIHALNLTTGEDVRATVNRQHVLPRWGGENLPFIFSAQEPGSDRWQVFEGFADGKSDPIILLDGRTPDWSPNGRTIAFQGTDPAGNQPGIYLRPFGGGEATRLTSHESDRMPVFSPDNARVAYMSTQNGNWDIFVVSAAGGQPVQVAPSPANDGLPAWSPDGNQLAFISDRGGSWAIHVVDLASGNVRKLTEWDGRNRADWLEAQLWWGR
jgi:serine/threonine-protein kinase